jgi:hypothetical protein
LLLVLFAVETLTTLSLRSYLPVHIFLGLLLLPPVALKLASTGWRFLRYYTRNTLYRHEGPPRLLLRMLAPLLVASTLTLFGSGVALIVVGHDGGLLLTVHAVSFGVWGVLMIGHVLAYIARTLRVGPADWLPLKKRPAMGLPSLSNVTSGRAGELRPCLLGAALVDGWWWLSRRIRGRPWPHRDDFGALHGDDHWQGEAVPECDDARPEREPLWEPHGRAVKRVNLAPFSRDVPILAAVVLYPRGPGSDWEAAVFWNQSADVVPQTGLDLRAVVTPAAASGQQHCGERQRSGRS